MWVCCSPALARTSQTNFERLNLPDRDSGPNPHKFTRFFNISHYVFIFGLAFWSESPGESRTSRPTRCENLKNRVFFNIDIKLTCKNCIFLLSKSRHQRACGCFLPFFAGLLDSQDVSPKRLARKTWRQHHDQQVLV